MFWILLSFLNYFRVNGSTDARNVDAATENQAVSTFSSCITVFLEKSYQPLRLSFKVLEYPFKQNRSMLKNMAVLLYTYFFNISLNILRPIFFNIHNLPFLRSPNIGKIKVKVGPKTNYFSYFMSSCTNRIEVFNNFFSLICNQPWDKQNCTRDFFPFRYFLNNQLLTVFMQNTLSSNYCYKKCYYSLLEKLVVTENTSTVLCSSLLEMCVQSLKLIVCAIFVLELVRCSPPRNHFLAKFL